MALYTRAPNIKTIKPIWTTPVVAKYTYGVHSNMILEKQLYMIHGHGLTHWCVRRSIFWLARWSIQSGGLLRVHGVVCLCFLVWCSNAFILQKHFWLEGLLPICFWFWDAAMVGSADSLGSEGKGKLSIDGVVAEWERMPEIRSHLREENATLFKEGVDACVKTCCATPVFEYLQPLLMRMAETTGSPQPLVDPLRNSLIDLYKTFSKNIPEPHIILESWMTRKFLGFIKMKCRVRKPSKDLWWHIRSTNMESLHWRASFRVKKRIGPNTMSSFL